MSECENRGECQPDEGLADALSPFGEGVKITQVGAGGGIDRRDEDDGAPTRRFISRPTFENFAVGESNKEAFEAMLSLANSPGSTAGVLFVHGPSGWGKTHLLEAAASRLLKRHPELDIAKMRGYEYLRDYILAARTGREDGFRRSHRVPEILFLDGIEYLDHKLPACQALAASVDAVTSGGGAVVMTSFVPLGDLWVGGSLRELVETGRAVGIAIPDREVRAGVIESLCSRWNSGLPSMPPREFFGWLSDVCPSDGHELGYGAQALVRVLNMLAEGLPMRRGVEFHDDDFDESWAGREIALSYGKDARGHDQNGIAALLSHPNPFLAEMIDPEASSEERPDGRRCSLCGERLDPGAAAYCGNCGARLSDSAESCGLPGPKSRIRIAAQLKRQEARTFERLLVMPDDELAGLLDPTCVALKRYPQDGSSAPGYYCETCGTYLGPDMTWAFSGALPHFCTGCGGRIVDADPWD